MTATDRKFYVYEHTRSDTGEVFYVGKGHGRRAWRLHERNTRHRRTVEKVERLGGRAEVRVVLQGLSERCALTFERIRIYQRRAEGARLANLTDGGEGSVGYVPTAETLGRMADAQRGKKRTDETKARLAKSATGRKHTDATKAKLSALNIGSTLNEKSRLAFEAYRATPEAAENRKRMHEGNRGRKHTDESRAKMTEALKAGWAAPESAARKAAIRARRAKPVVCLTTGEVYETLSDAAQAISVAPNALCRYLKGRSKKIRGCSLDFAYQQEAAGE